MAGGGKKPRRAQADASKIINGVTTLVNGVTALINDVAAVKGVAAPSSVAAFPNSIMFITNGTTVCFKNPSHFQFHPKSMLGVYNTVSVFIHRCDFSSFLPKEATQLTGRVLKINNTSS